MDLIRSGEWLSVTYKAPRRSRVVQIDIEANDLVDVWVIPEEELAAFSADEDFTYYTKRTNVSRATLTFKPDAEDEWALIVDNKQSVDVEVSYDVIW